MQWLDEMFKNPIGHRFWLAQRREPGHYILFGDTPPTYSDIAMSVAVVKVVVTQKIVVYGQEREG